MTNVEKELHAVIAMIVVLYINLNMIDLRQL